MSPKELRVGATYMSKRRHPSLRRKLLAVEGNEVVFESWLEGMPETWSSTNCSLRSFAAWVLKEVE